MVADPAVPGSRIGFRQVPEDRTVKNRLHYATFADPEGNEFDVIAR
ncbi:hypothetical protein [Streptomyces pseudovenezuelae]|uniref:Glyoxalase n=1 Tax=Streptomyces pseudovenezuelae TaxID=67350 RepID=A0ABT6LHC0_9ACTN|nr:hypothetical protein [Streptomyces pseudovenezuelae]MDH6215685.1 hypothetical protein [Streptomyces pseudovenezuelae]